MNSSLRYQVRHRTAFYYAAPVSGSANTLHLHPSNFSHQRTISCLIRVLPATRLRAFNDLYENITHHFEIPNPHQRLDIESVLKVENFPVEFSDRDEAAILDDYKEPAIHERTWSFLQASHYVSFPPEIWRQAVDVTCHHPRVLDKAKALMSWIHEEFTYDLESTKVSSKIEEVFEHRSGVCQDFTHVMLGMCRSIGIPARYTSGYLYNGPRDTLIGAQASHAWVEIFLPDSGWIGLDPTNNTLADTRFIKVAVGRDYDDVAPVKGQYQGTASCRMEVDLEVSLL
ncbi:transglutaminase domain-containing protein [Haloferula chungangensis]|uniref:Transglutaminase domain-containing protein n=1 Tax=Haloferula chungangensis TaxID=1048331 RepID=A0ABW2L6M5_9BACT